MTFSVDSELGLASDTMRGSKSAKYARYFIVVS
jgi:hypothetical protein